MPLNKKFSVTYSTDEAENVLGSRAYLINQLREVSMTTFSHRLPKSFFQNKLTGLRNRLQALQHFLEKASDEKRKKQIQEEIEKTNSALKQTELDSCFSRLEVEDVASENN